jgi:5-formyltetrahydrofolate cyclo-ligase
MDPSLSFAHLKKALRRSVRSLILTLGPQERAAQDAALVRLFDELPGYAEAGTVLLYAKAFAEELETRPFLIHALEAGKQVVLPKVDRHRQPMRLFQILDPSLDLEPDTLAIPEPRTQCLPIKPEEIDWVLVPGLAFDLHCYRLGRGAGHYDRLLPRLRPDASRWALGYDCQIVADLPAEPHDVALDGVATPSHWIRLGDSNFPELISR